ncbi:class I SAM-dependent methyltransferase [Candidatus Saccharibacteria bacterium]|nr:class I SAM-dependent methyltransferase [Candidatus Saccharibacteria bacterium]
MNPELKQFILQYFPEGGKALDLGCGNGTDVKGLKEMGWKCDGVDLTTGTDLNEVYLSPNAPYDLVYSNYVIQQLKAPESLIITIEKNLKDGGKFFIHTFDKSDEVVKKKYTKESIAKLFENTTLKPESYKVFRIFDNEIGHHHWHQILQISGTKKSNN